MLFIGAVDGIHISSWSTLDTNLSCIFFTKFEQKCECRCTLEEAAEIAVTDLTASQAAREKSGSHKVELGRRNGQPWMIVKQEPQGFWRFFKARNKGQMKSPAS